MGITQRNEYLPAQDLSNLSANVDDTRIGVDQTQISVNFTTTPATVTVKVGSIIEVNGNSYLITASDETFQMDSASDTYLTFSDNPSTVFDSTTTKGTFDTTKQGFYQADTITRTLKWYIDQTAETVEYDIDIYNGSMVDGIQEINATDINVVNVDATNIDATNIDATNIDVSDLDVTGSIQVGGGTALLEIRRVTSASSPISYPSGFSQTNTKILGCQVTEANIRYSLGYNDSGDYVMAQLGISNIEVETNLTATFYDLILLRV